MVKHIVHVLREGIAVTPQLCDYIDATFSSPSLSELERLLGNASDPDRESLLELLFFPDESTQQRLEPLLPPESGLTQADVDVIAAEIAGRRILAAIVLPDSRGRLALEFPPGQVEPFLRRLNLTHRIGSRLAEATAALESPAEKIAVRVKLRNSRKPMGDGKIVFLCDLLSALAGDPLLLDCLDFSLGVLQDAADDADLYAVLMQRRRSVWHQLQQAERFEEKLKRDNIETLMLRGERVPVAARDELGRTIAVIEHIGLAVFGRLDQLGCDHLQNDDIAFGPNVDPEEIFRRLL
jgi:hypothetical protein